MAEALGKVCALQNHYGKTSGELETLVEGFAWVMRPYETKAVLSGIAQHVLNNATIPTPYEIRQIIDPKPPKFKPNPSYYVKLQQIFKEHGPFGLNDDEIEYIRKYEDHMIKECKDSQ